jgi:hypothetical protein
MAAAQTVRWPRLQLPSCADAVTIWCVSYLLVGSCELVQTFDICELVLRGIHTIHQAMTHHRSYQIRYTGESRCPRHKWIPAFAGKARRDLELHQLNESVH